MPVRCLVAVLLLLLPGAGTTARAAGPAASKVVFVSQRDAPGDFAGDIYALDPATGTIARLTRGEAIETDAPLAVSHDGSRVAYVTSNYVVRVVESDGSSTRSVAGCEYYAFSFSPDGRELACTESPGNEPVVATVDLDTGATQVLAPGTDPAWSPDGATIAFIDAKQHPAIVPATGGAARAVASPAVDNLAWPAVVWSPDSRRLAFVEGDVDVGPQTLWIVDAAGRVLHRLRGVGGVPAWSPDGAAVAAVDRHTHQLVLVDTARGHKRQLTHERVSVSAPSWSPDGRRLAYLRARPLLRYSSDPEQDIVTIGRDGRGRRALTSPFPNGGATDRAIWTTGALVGGMRPPRVRVVPLHPTRETTLGDRASNVVADGPRAATVIDIGCVAVIWDERSGGRTSASSCSTQDVDTETMMDDTMSGPRFAWLQQCNCRYSDDSALDFVNVNDKHDHGSLYSYDPGHSSPTLRSLAGDGGLIAFDLVPPGGEPQLWTVPLRNAAAAGVCPLPEGDIEGPTGLTDHGCRRLRAGDGADALDADGGRILARRADGTLLVIDVAHDSLVHSWPFKPEDELTGAALSGARVVVSTVDAVRVYDVTSGALRATWRLPTDLTSPSLRDIDGDLAVYVRGPAVHVLRLTDGRDVALHADGQGEEVDAAIERQGLYYVYNVIGRLKPGRLVFVPRARLRGQLAAAR